MNTDSSNGVKGLVGPATSEHAELIELFLEALGDMKLREAEERTGVSDATIANLRSGQRTVRKATEEKLVEYLRARGKWPPPPTEGEIAAAKGGRAELTFRHFTSRAIMRHFGWNRAQAVSACFLYAEEEGFTDTEMADLAELTNVYLRIAQEESQ